jgi:hypothetical protein
VQFSFPRRRLNAVRAYLERPTMAAGEIGKYALEYFMENEEIK